MATLTEASIFSKKALKWFAITLVVAIFFFILLTLGRNFKDILFPKEPPPATVAFGKLPPADIASYQPPANSTYILETVTGNLPQLPTLAKVFMIAQDRPSFGDLERAIERAAKIDFTNPPQEIATGIVKFSDPTNQRSLTIETATGNFDYQTSYLNDPQIIVAQAPSVEDAQNSARNFLSKIGFDLTDFPQTKMEVRMYQIDSGRLVETEIAQKANLTQVAFRHQDLDKLPVISPRDDQNELQVLVAKNAVVSASAHITKIQRFVFATYPLKSVQAAFSLLKSQKGAVNKELKENQLKILDVSLGYLEQKNGQYLQPVYLFGGKDFTAYAPAVDDSWIIPTQ